MSLRYKGMPYKGSNIQVDDLPPLCFCKFVAVGVRLNAASCPVHTHRAYSCDMCSCLDYRPSRVKKSAHWPLCVCGHIAQEHN